MPANFTLRFIAILIGRLGLTWPQLNEEYVKFEAGRQAGWEPPTKLDDLLKAVVEKYTGDPETPMLDPDSPTRHCMT